MNEKTAEEKLRQLLEGEPLKPSAKTAGSKGRDESARTQLADNFKREADAFIRDFEARFFHVSESVKQKTQPAKVKEAVKIQEKKPEAKAKISVPELPVIPLVQKKPKEREILSKAETLTESKTHDDEPKILQTSEKTAGLPKIEDVQEAQEKNNEPEISQTPEIEQEPMEDNDGLESFADVEEEPDFQDVEQDSEIDDSYSNPEISPDIESDDNEEQDSEPLDLSYENEEEPETSQIPEIAQEPENLQDAAPDNEQDSGIEESYSEEPDSIVEDEQQNESQESEIETPEMIPEDSGENLPSVEAIDESQEEEPDISGLDNFDEIPESDSEIEDIVDVETEPEDSESSEIIDVVSENENEAISNDVIEPLESENEISPEDEAQGDILEDLTGLQDVQDLTENDSDSESDVEEESENENEISEVNETENELPEIAVVDSLENDIPDIPVLSDSDDNEFFDVPEDVNENPESEIQEEPEEIPEKDSEDEAVPVSVAMPETTKTAEDKLMADIAEAMTGSPLSLESMESPKPYTLPEDFMSLGDDDEQTAEAKLRANIAQALSDSPIDEARKQANQDLEQELNPFDSLSNFSLPEFKPNSENESSQAINENLGIEAPELQVEEPFLPDFNEESDSDIKEDDSNINFFDLEESDLEPQEIPEDEILENEPSDLPGQEISDFQGTGQHEQEQEQSQEPFDALNLYSDDENEDDESNEPEDDEIEPESVEIEDISLPGFEFDSTPSENTSSDFNLNSVEEPHEDMPSLLDFTDSEPEIKTESAAADPDESSDNDSWLGALGDAVSTFEEDSHDESENENTSIPGLSDIELNLDMPQEQEKESISEPIDLGITSAGTQPEIKSDIPVINNNNEEGEKNPLGGFINSMLVAALCGVSLLSLFRFDSIADRILARQPRISPAIASNESGVYDYSVEFISDSELNNKMSQMGKEGWHIASSIRSTGDNSNKLGYNVIFMRER